MPQLMDSMPQQNEKPTESTRKASIFPVSTNRTHNINEESPCTVARPWKQHIILKSPALIQKPVLLVPKEEL